MNLENIRSILIFIIMIPIVTTDESYDYSINFNIVTVPMHYNVKLIPHELNDFVEAKKIIKHDFAFNGESSININNLYSRRYIRLQKLNLDIINSVTLITKNGIIYKTKTIKYYSLANLLEIHFSHVLLLGLYTIKMIFSRQAIDDEVEGFFRNIYVNEDGHAMWVVASHNMANGARRLFPCWDEPQFRTTFAISIKHHLNFRALSNMPMYTEVLETNTNLIWTHFYITPPISTYHIAIVLTNYISININNNMSLWCREDFREHSLKFAKRVIENVTLYLKSEFAEVEIPKIDHVAIPNFPQDGTSKWGLIFHRESDIIYDEKSDAIMRKIEIARLIAPKIAYQWFGNAVSPYWWSSHWLHNGLAILFGEEAISKIFNGTGIMDFFIVQNQYESLHLDSHFDMNPPQINSLSDIYALFSISRYIKVPVVLRMLRVAITDMVFRRGVHTYLQKYKFHSLKSSNFWYIQGDVANTSSPYFIPSDFPAWLVYRHYPIVRWAIEDSSWGKIAQNFNTSTYGNWWIPISIILKSNLPGNVEVWLTPREPYNEMDYITKDDWIMIDIRQAGYYRINYETENWRRIAQYLSSQKYKDISVINRAKIIDDAFHFIIARQINISIFWKLANYLSQETDYSAWYPMIKMLEYVSCMIQFSKHPISHIITGKLKSLLDGPLQILGSEEHSTENEFIKCLRQEILEWACKLGHSQCLVMAKQKLQFHLENPATNKISPGWKKWTYCNGLRESDKSVWIKAKNIFLQIRNHELLPYLVCSLYRSIDFEDLRSLLSNYSDFESDMDTRFSVIIFHSIVSTILHDDWYLNVIMIELENIKPEVISPVVAFTDIINHLYTEDQLSTILGILKKPLYVYNEQHISKIRLKVQTRLSQIKKQIDHFQFIES